MRKIYIKVNIRHNVIYHKGRKNPDVSSLMETIFKLSQCATSLCSTLNSTSLIHCLYFLLHLCTSEPLCWSGGEDDLYPLFLQSTISKMLCRCKREAFLHSLRSGRSLVVGESFAKGEHYQSAQTTCFPIHNTVVFFIGIFFQSWKTDKAFGSTHTAYCSQIPFVCTILAAYFDIWPLKS